MKWGYRVKYAPRIGPGSRTVSSETNREFRTAQEALEAAIQNGAEARIWSIEVFPVPEACVGCGTPFREIAKLRDKGL